MKMTVVEEFCEKLLEFENLYAEKCREQSRLDSVICDIHHSLEFGVNKITDTNKLIKLLKQTLKDRRVIKNEIHIMQQTKTTFSINSDRIRSHLEKVETKITTEKKYTPRQLPELNY